MITEDTNTDILRLLREKKQSNRRQLRELEKSPIVFGMNSIHVTKISNTLIGFTETINGITHSHRRHLLENSVSYVEYKKSLLEKSTQAENIINVGSQSKQYQRQFHLVEEAIDELRYLITLCAIESNFNKKFTIENTENSIIVNIETGVIIEIRERLNTVSSLMSMMFSLHITGNVIVSTIHDNDDVLFHIFLSKLSKISVGNFSDRINKDFESNFVTMIEGLKQLPKLYTQIDNSNNTTENAEMYVDIFEYLRKGQPGTELSIPFDNHTFDDQQFLRKLNIRKISRVRTVIEILAQSDTQSFIEYRIIISKISHNLTENTNNIINIVRKLT